MSTSADEQAARAWPSLASTAVAGLLAGPERKADVVGSTGIAAYLSVRAPEASPRLLALLRPEAVRLPIGLCSPEAPLPPVGATVRIGGGTVDVPAGAWRPARWWDPRPRVNPTALARSGSDVLAAVRREPARSFGLPLDEGNEVVRAMVAGDPGPAVGVLGWGPGLTPAGDDVVAGALAVLNLTGGLGPSVWPAIEARLRNRTTALSAALLAAAHRGQVIPRAARLLGVLAAGGSWGDVLAAAAGLFAVGSTSGHDLCLGIAAALAAIREHSNEEAA